VGASIASGNQTCTKICAAFIELASTNNKDKKVKKFIPKFKI
jgi:hypothetical protein